MRYAALIPLVIAATLAVGVTSASTGHAATRLPDGRVFVTGVGAGSPVAGAGQIVQSFDPTSNGRTRLKDLKLSRSGHAAPSIEVIHP